MSPIQELYNVVVTSPMYSVCGVVSPIQALYSVVVMPPIYSVGGVVSPIQAPLCRGDVPYKRSFSSFLVC